MKNTQRLYKHLAATSVCILAVACSKSDDKKSNDSRHSSETYVYSFEYNGCKTGEHSFNSIEALCAGLQDEALNKHCAQNMREDEFNFRSCPGGFTPKFKSTPAPKPNPTPPTKPGTNPTRPKPPGAQNPMNGFEELVLKKDQIHSNVFRSSPEGAGQVIQDVIEITCISSVEEISQRNLNSGILMLNQSQVTIRPDWNDPTKSLPMALTLKCAQGNTSEKIGELIKDQKVQTRQLKQGHQPLLDVIQTAGIESSNTTAFTMISCHKDAVQAAISGANGISLGVGSSILVQRDLNYTFADGTKTKEHAPFVLFTCE